MDEGSGRHAAGAVLDGLPPVGPPPAPVEGPREGSRHTRSSAEDDPDGVPDGIPDGPAGTAAGDPAPECDAVRTRLLAEAGDALRGRVAELVSVAVGAMPPEDLPAPVRPVARFTPAKRARLGGAPMIAALTQQDGFADAVLAWWREHRPADWDGPTAPADSLHTAAVALLEGRDEGVELVREAAEREEVTRLRADLDAARGRADRLAAELAQVVAERDEAQEATRMIPIDHSEEVVKLRARLREQGVRVRRAEEAASDATGRLEAGQADVLTELAELRRERDRHRSTTHAAEAHARRLAHELEVVRRAAHESRAADDNRLALLLDTLSGAAAGVRRELGIRGVDPQAPRPADVAGPTSGAAAAGPAADGAALDRLLGLPEVHVLVDGYNVTKTAWGDLTLLAQRDRLAGALAPLAARTRAEITVVFDGAGVVGVPTPSVRGVRVMFSEAGVIADDVLRRLVAAEPQGRPLVVVTSDRAIVESVRRHGAHPVASSVLIERLARV